MELLQHHAVPCGRMLHIGELPSDPHIVARGFFATLHQPGLDDPVIVETGPCRAERLPEPPLRPAPRSGEHSREVCAEVLGMDDEAIADLVARGVIDEPRPREPRP
jgi:crotonobetainyl-CoA:carnitine CoA-transferase CaiB-like acyl-CoA transferase